MRAAAAALARAARVTPRTTVQASQSTMQSLRGAVASRDFSRSSSINGINGINGSKQTGEDDHDDDGLSPFERLLQHAQQFRDQAGLEELPAGIDRELLKDDKDDNSTPQPNRDDAPDEHGHQPQDQEDKQHEEKEEAHGAPLHAHRHSERRYENHRHRHQDQARFRAWSMNERLRRQIGAAPHVDFEHGLRDLDPRAAKAKMFEQLLVHEQDLDRVCTNCGERGHLERLCPLPPICANCGDVGHRRHECPHERFSPEQLRTTRQRRRIARQAVRERHDRMKKAFDDELNEYVEQHDTVQKNRKRPSDAEDNH